MHEVSIVEVLLEQVESEIVRAGATGRVERVKLRIGRMSGVNADSIRFAFELLTPGTRLDGAVIEIEEPSAICLCTECGARSEIDELCLECPECRGTEIRVEGGQDMILETIDVEEP